MKKTTDNLSIATLKAMFNVEYGGTDLFKQACETGIIEKMIKECADAMYGGDTMTVLRQLSRNVSSYKTNASKRPVVNNAHKNLDEMVKLFDQVIHDMMPKGGAKTGTTKYAKPAHMLTTEDIDEITDPEILRKRINSLADYLCKGFSGLTEEDLEGAELVKYQQVKSVKDYARARRAELVAAQPVEISDSLAAKLGKTGKVTFSAAELEELKKLLGK